MSESISQLEEKRRERLIFILAFALVISVMNSTMFNIAIPAITDEFGLKPSQAGWIVTGYIIVYAIGSVMYGKLADQYKLKTLLTAGLLFFAVGSVIGFTAANFWMIVAGRLLQAAGASVMPATSMIIPSSYFTPETRGRALGITSAGMALGTAIGPIVAGFVTSFISWHYLFIVSLLVLVTLPFFRKYLNDEAEKQKTNIDLAGAAFLAGTLALLLLAVTKSAPLLATAGAVLFVFFLWRMNKANDPFIRFSLFRNKHYSIGILVSALSSGIGFGIPYLTPLLLQTVNGLSPLMSGLIMFPGALVAAVLGKKAGLLADQKGNHFLAYMALLSFFLGYSFLALIAGLSPLIVMAVLLLACIGQTFIQIALGNTVSQSLPKEHAGVGMGVFMMTNFIAGATSITFISKALEIHHTAIQLNPFLHNQESINYSNIYAVLALLIAAVAFIYSSTFKKQSV
ncbi:MFS transporter [Domibacillus indicus]|uniref:MFS transporter n=1 Tax=Domibacillus indicus TaxID=1437523 RepID=UPI00203FB1B8|nr:MFS transporter [Domibacillus indicus]MCM3789243.1 MFS transporter [Domibacillus indicus]